MFAGRGIALPGFLMTLLVIVGALGCGVGAGWATDAITTAMKRPDATPSASPSPSPTADVDVTLPPMEPITRKLTADDARAGVTTTKFSLTGDSNFTVVPGAGLPADNARDVRWVSIAVEGGIQVDASAFANYVMAALQDGRGWGAADGLQFVKTDGAADYRILLASPTTAQLLCPDQHLVASAGPVQVDGSSASATASEAPVAPSAGASAGAEDDAILCDGDGAIVISIYDWIAGLTPFHEDVDGARTFLIQHRMGHILGKPDVPCAAPRADVMVDQSVALPDGCAVNPWPLPDAPSAPQGDQSTSATPSAEGTT